MGSLANGALRKKRVLAHQEFDRLWKGESPIFTRKQAYNWLSDRLGGHLRSIHIGSMGEGWCDWVIAEVQRVIRMHNENQNNLEDG
jgi:hypothetical protein